jgi:hypothetical protein
MLDSRLNFTSFQLEIHRRGYPFQDNDPNFEWALVDQIDLVHFRAFLTLEIERLNILLANPADAGI